MVVAQCMVRAMVLQAQIFLTKFSPANKGLIPSDHVFHFPAVHFASLQSICVYSSRARLSIPVVYAVVVLSVRAT